MSEASSILVFGRDPLLLDTRASILRLAGYRVIALTPKEGTPPTEAVNLLVLCHTLTAAERNALQLFAAAQRPAAGLLCLTPTEGSLEGFPDHFNIFDGPAKFVETVQKLLIRR